MLFQSHTINPTVKMEEGIYVGSTTPEQRSAMASIYKAGKIAPLKNALTGFELDDFQTVFPALAYIAKRFVIGADTGLGKSLMIALYLRIHKQKGTLGSHKKALVVTTTTSLNQIKTVIESSTGMRVKHLPGDSTALIKTIQAEDLTKYDIFIVANSVFGKSVEFANIFVHMAPTFNIFIADESMVFANPNSLTSLSVKGWIKNFEYRLLLNATIVEKDLKQLYHQFDLIEPNLLPPIKTLEKKYAKWSKPSRGKKATLVGYENLDRLISAMPFHFVNMNRADLGKEFPSVNHLVPLKMTRLQESIVTPNNYNYALFSPTTQRETSVIPFDIFNIPALTETINIVKREFEARGKGIVIYAEPVACKDVLSENLRKAIPGLKVGIIDGNTVDKDYSRNEFNAGRIHVLIINIPEALDLTAGEVMIMYTMPSKHIQARARIARGLSPNGEPKVYYYLVYLNSPQSDYIKTTMLRDESTTNSALQRGYDTVSNLVKELRRLEM